MQQIEAMDWLWIGNGLWKILVSTQSGIAVRGPTCHSWQNYIAQRAYHHHRRWRFGPPSLTFTSTRASIISPSGHFL